MSNCFLRKLPLVECISSDVPLNLLDHPDPLLLDLIVPSDVHFNNECACILFYKSLVCEPVHEMKPVHKMLTPQSILGATMPSIKIHLRV